MLPLWDEKDLALQAIERASTDAPTRSSLMPAHEANNLFISTQILDIAVFTSRIFLTPDSCDFWLAHISFKAEKKFERLRGIRLECFAGQWKVEKVAIAGEFRSDGRIDFFKSHRPLTEFGFNIFLFE
jgi:hypothetical protein